MTEEFIKLANEIHRRTPHVSVSQALEDNEKLRTIISKGAKMNTERSIAEKMIVDGRDLADKAAMIITNAETKLAELDKPKLKPVHGSKMVTEDGEYRIALYDRNSALRAFSLDGMSRYLAKNDYYTTLDEPTIFDDLAALAEPLSEFEIDGLFVGIKLDGTINIGGHHLAINKAAEFGQKFNRVAATAKKKE